MWNLEMTPFSNIWSTIDMIAHTAEKDIPRKAFDTVNHKFMVKCLKSMNFGEYFGHCILHWHGEHGGSWHHTTKLRPSRGITEGGDCPILANLFILLVECLGYTIMKNLNIKGINFNGIEFKISQYAYSKCWFLSNQTYLKAALDTIHFFYNL